MASAFNLTAQINLRGPTNLKPIIANIRRELGSVNANISINIDNRAIKSVDIVTNRLNSMNKVLVTAKNNTISLNQSLKDLSASLTSIQNTGSGASSSVSKTSQNMEKVSKNIKVARTEMEEFGKQSALAVRRFAAFSVVTSGIFAVTNAITGAFKAFIDFDKELIRLQQVTGSGATGIKILQKEITNLATGLGVSSEALTKVTTTLAQAGFTIEETRVALKALAKTELAPSFDNLTDTTEGAIAAIRQFGLQAGELESALGSINAVAAAFAVESSDIITAIQRTGGVFAAASKGVSEGTDALNEFISVFTSVRATTRESAETIATGLRTIFTRIQRAGTIEQLKQFGVNLQDLENKFVGPYEAVKRLSEGLSKLDPRDVRFSAIVEELGGFRQIGKVIPLIQQFATAQQALGIAQKGQSSLTDAQVKAQQSLANQLAKVREQFLALIRDIGQSQVFTGLFKIVLGLTSGFLSLASAFKPILPILAVFGAIKGVSAIGQFATGFFGGLKKSNIPSGSTTTQQTTANVVAKEKNDATIKAADAIRLNTDALKNLTSTISSLDSTIKSRGSTGLNGGGKVMAFARGGVVPGTGNRDTVPAILSPGEFVIRKKAVETIGAGNLHRMNKYANGGVVQKFKDGKIVKPKSDEPTQGAHVGGNLIIDPQTFKQILSQTQDKKIFAAIAEQSGIKSKNLQAAGLKLVNELSDNQTLDLIKSIGLEAKENIILNIPRSWNQALRRGNPDLVPQNDLSQYIRSKKSAISNLPKILLQNSSLSNNIANAISALPSNPRSSKFGIPLFDEDQELDPIKNVITQGIKTDVLSLMFKGASRGFWQKLGYSVARARSQDRLNVKGINWTESQSDMNSTMRIVGSHKADIPTHYLNSGGLIQKFTDGGQPKSIGIYDSDQISGTGKKDILSKILGSGKPYDVLQGPAGAGKTTLAKKLYGGNFVLSPEDIEKYAEFVVLSGAGLTKKGELSQDLMRLLGGARRITALDPSMDRLMSQRNTRLQDTLAGNIADTRSASQLEGTLNAPGSIAGEILKRYGNASILQHYTDGSPGGVKQTGRKISDVLLRRIKDVGGKEGIVKRVEPQMVAAALKKATDTISSIGTSKQLLTLPSLNSLPNGSLLEPILEPIIAAAEEKKRAEDQAKRDQLGLNLRAAGGGAYQFGLVSIYGPNGELGYSSLSNAQEIEGKNGEKFLTQIIQKSLPSKFAKTIQRTQADIANLPSRAAARLQNAQIFGTRGPLAFDFDETLVKGADIPGKNPIDYNDLTKVQQALGNARLTTLGSALSKRLAKNKKLLDRIRVLTARPPSNAPLLAETLQRLGLPIPASKITGVSGGLNKVTNLGKNETLIDDALENIESVIGGGKKAIQYTEPQPYDPNNPSSLRNIQVMEGYALEEMVRRLGVNVTKDEDAIPTRPIDYPSGLGTRASIWGIPGTIPTDTKRTADSSAVRRLWDEAKRYFVEKFANGGSPKDTVPALLTPGEFVINAKAAKQIGYAKLNKLNHADKIQGFNKGGIVDGIQTFATGGLAKKAVSVADIQTQIQSKQQEIDALKKKTSGSKNKGDITKEIDRLQQELQDLTANLAPATEEFLQGLQNLNKPIDDIIKVFEYRKSKLEQQLGEQTKALAGTTDVGEQAVLNEQIAKTKKALDKYIQVINVTSQAYDLSRDTVLQYNQLEKSGKEELAKAQQDAINALRASGAAVNPQAIKDLLASPEFKPRVEAAQEKITSSQEKQKEFLIPPPVPPAKQPFRETAQMAKEREEYTKYRAEQAGMSVRGYKYSLAQKLGKATYDVGREIKYGRTETKNIAAGRRRELLGINIKEATKEGATTEQAKKVQGIIAEFAASLQKANPALGAAQARDAAIDLATKLSEGTDSVEQIIQANSTLNDSINGVIDANQIQTEAFRRTALETGESIENLQATISPKQLRQQAFVQSVEGQRFGALAEFAPGLTEAFSKTGIGKALGRGADFISGKGGRLSKAFAGAGGFTGIGSGLAVGAESLKQLLPRTITSNPNAAGALGAVSGAGVGMAAGAQLGMIAGPVGALIGGVGGAIIGGIQGFFSAKNQAILTNALEATAKSAGNLDMAFKRLEMDINEANLAGVQKEFGNIIESFKPIEEMAFAKVGFENIGSMAASGIQDIQSGNTMMGGLKAFIGTSPLGALIDYFSVSQAQKEEATSTMVTGAGQRMDTATKLVETQLKMSSADEVAKILDNLQKGIVTVKDGIISLNPITDQYVKGSLAAAKARQKETTGTEDLTLAQQTEIIAIAQERAARDGFMKKRKEAQATEEQINKELQTNLKEALKEGAEYNQLQSELLSRQVLLAKATKQLAINTENLIDIFRRANAYAEKYSSEIDQFSMDINSLVSGLGGDTGMRDVNRQNEQVLGNLSAYTKQQVQAAAQTTAGFMGGTPEAQKLANVTVAQKTVLDEIPQLLRNANNNEERSKIIDQLKGTLGDLGLAGADINEMFNQLEQKIIKEGGITASELQEFVGQAFEGIGRGAETLVNIQKKYNDTLQQARKFQQDYNKAILEANNYTRKAAQVRLNAELDLAKALGRSPTLEQLNQPFDTEIASLTSNLIKSGQLAAESAADPKAIADAITAAEKQKLAIEKTNPTLLAAAQNLPQGQEGDALRQQLNQSQLDNIAAIGNLTIASNEGRAALEKLATDGTKAANALAKIQEEQQAIEGFANFAEQVFTADPQQLAQMELKARGLNAARASGPEFMQSRFNRQQAYGGLAQAKQFLTPQDYRNLQAELFLKSAKAKNIQTQKIAGKQFTVEELAERIRGGISETDPNVQKFREASEVQAKANEALGKLNLEQAFTIQEAMKGLENFLTNEFPNIYKQAVIDSENAVRNQAPAENKPEIKVITPQEVLDQAKEARRSQFMAEVERNTGVKNVTLPAPAPPGTTTSQTVATAQAAQPQKDVFAEAWKKKEAESAQKTLDALLLSQQAKQEELSRKEKGYKISKRGASKETPYIQNKRELFEMAQKDMELINQQIEEQKRRLQAATGTGPQQNKEVTQTNMIPTTGAMPRPEVDVFVQKRREQAMSSSQTEIDRLSRMRDEKIKERNAKQSKVHSAKDTAFARGTLYGDNYKIVDEEVLAAQKEVNLANQDLLTIGNQLAAEKKRLAALKEESEAEKARIATLTKESEAATQNNRMVLPTNNQSAPSDNLPSSRTPTPVPVTMPPRTPVLNTEVTPTPAATPTQAAMITINPDGLKGLETFNTTFSTYVDKLVNHTFPPIEGKVDVNHTVNVNMTGAASITALSKTVQELAAALIQPKIIELEEKIKRNINSEFPVSANTQPTTNAFEEAE